MLEDAIQRFTSTVKGSSAGLVFWDQPENPSDDEVNSFPITMQFTNNNPRMPPID